MGERAAAPANPAGADPGWWSGRVPRRVHVVGVAGAGMSAVAEALLALGHRVSGSDRAEAPILAHLAGRGATVAVGHHPGLARAAEVVVRSSAVGDDDPEVAAARRAGIPVLARAAALAGLCAQRRTVAVGGTHGKTTTSALAAAVLEAGGRAPSWLVGAAVRGAPSGARWVPGRWLVAEADESDGTLLALPRHVAVVTNVEADHLGHWGDLGTLTAGFAEFLAGAPHRVVCLDDPGAAALAAGPGVLGYGTSPRAEVRLEDVVPAGLGASFTLVAGGERVEGIGLGLPGVHNARNAAAAAAVGLVAGVDLATAASALAAFPGLRRRFEVRASQGGVTFVDDYAHLPGEVAALVSAAAGVAGGRRLVCAFQPHRYTRTAAVGGDFGPAFAGAALVVVSEVYGAGEAPVPGATGAVVAEAVARAAEAAGGRPRVVAVADLDAAADVLAGELRPGDLCLTIGAGDVTTLTDRVLARQGQGRGR